MSIGRARIIRVELVSIVRSSEGASVLLALIHAFRINTEEYVQFQMKNIYLFGCDIFRDHFAPTHSSFFFFDVSVFVPKSKEKTSEFLLQNYHSPLVLRAATNDAVAVAASVTIHSKPCHIHCFTCFVAPSPTEFIACSSISCCKPKT